MHSVIVTILIMFIFIFFINIDDVIGSFPCSTIDECKNMVLWHIPGPNPIVSPYRKDIIWANIRCEVAGGVYKINETYYFIYIIVLDQMMYIQLVYQHLIIY